MQCQTCGAELNKVSVCPVCGTPAGNQQPQRQAYQQPTYQQPTYQQPIFQQQPAPQYQQPNHQHQQPVYQPPVYQQPIYQQPVGGPQKSKNPIYKRWWFWVIAVILALAVFGSAGNTDTPEDDDSGANISNAGGSSDTQDSSEPQQATEAPEKITEISATDLFTAYDENEVAADNLYKGQKLKITGTVRDIGKDILDDTYIVLDCGEVLFGIQCYFSDDELGAVAKLKKGETVTLIGVCNGQIGNVLVEDCKLQ